MTHNKNNRVPVIDGYLSLDDARTDLVRISGLIKNHNCESIQKLIKAGPIMSMQISSCIALLTLIQQYSELKGIEYNK